MRPLAAAIVSLVLLGGCTGDPEPAPVTPAPTSTTAPTPSPTPQPPTDPVEAAKRYDASTADELAFRLAESEATIRGPDTTAEALEQSGRFQQASYRQLVRTPDWREPVLSSLPEALRAHARANLEAGEALRGTLPKQLRDEPPSGWRIVAPLPPDELLAHYREAESASGVHWSFLAAINLVETRMGRIRGDSHAGARGPMQFMPATWEQYGAGGDIESHRDSIHAAARMLRANGGPADMDNALFRYNPTRYYVTAVHAYARVMREEPRAYQGYYHWQVYYATTRGDALLEVGWGS